MSNANLQKKNKKKLDRIQAIAAQHEAHTKHQESSDTYFLLFICPIPIRTKTVKCKFQLIILYSGWHYSDYFGSPWTLERESQHLFFNLQDMAVIILDIKLEISTGEPTKQGKSVLIKKMFVRLHKNKVNTYKSHARLTDHLE